MTTSRSHDTPTIVAIAIAAFILADLSHEALGHGIAAYLSGARQLVLSYTYLSSDLDSRIISISGPLVNVLEGLAAFALLKAFRPSPSVALFLFFLMSFDLLDAAAYLIYSAALGSGDLAVLFAGSAHMGLVRGAMIVGGVALYALVIRAGSGLARRFGASSGAAIAVTLPAYVAPILLNASAALLNPLGLKYFLISALPTTAGANLGLLAMRGGGGDETTARQIVGRSFLWIAAAAILAGFFVFVVGPGIAWNR